MAFAYLSRRPVLVLAVLLSCLNNLLIAGVSALSNGPLNTNVGKSESYSQLLSLTSSSLSGPPKNRRDIIRDSSLLVGASLVASSTAAAEPALAAGANKPPKYEPLPSPLQTIINRPPTDSRPFFVQPDSTASLSPRVVGVSTPSAIEYISSPTVQSVWLGEHHNSLADHQLQVSILKDLIQQWEADRPVVVGLEAIQQQFQSVLDNYIDGKISDQELFVQTEWEKRWFWPYEGYLPVFQFCRANQIPLLALSVDSEVLEKCEIGGLGSLSPEEMKRYIPDGKGFNGFTSTTAFREYIAYEIKPSYELHDDMGILGSTVMGNPMDQPMTFTNFYASRILRDEAMATAAARWIRKSSSAGGKEGRVVGLIGSDHVKFSCGVPARTARLLSQPQDSAMSIMLNPTPIDTARSKQDSKDNEADPAGANDLTLQIRFAAIAGRNDPAVRRSVTGGDAKADVLQALDMKQVKEGNNGVLPVADMFWLSPKEQQQQQA